MFGLDMLDVAIGIAFVYLLVSLLCSAIVESAEAVLKRRSSDLERGIGELLRDPNLVARFYNHPLINGLFKGTYKPGMRDLPSYIPSRSFALAIMDLLISPDPSQHKGVAGAAGPGTGAGVSTAALVGGMTGDPLADQARHAVLTLVNAAAGDAQKARENIEFWFDTAMDRVSGGYKRRAQRALFVIGLIVAVGLNIDTVRILRELMTNKAKREAIVAIATNYAKQPAGDITKEFDSVSTELGRLGLPLGWPSCRKCDRQTVKILDPCWQSCWKQNLSAAGGLTLVGWLLTAFAVCLGAPFWFDLLNKFMVVRSTVKPREKSGTEGPKEPQAPPPSQ
ncbi:MAG: hypothetical protein AABO58_10760 [Acidobacteriota bacterium]